MQDIQQYIEFFTFSKTLNASNDDDMPVAKKIIITNIIANFCAWYSQAFDISAFTHGCRQTLVAKFNFESDPREQQRANVSIEDSHCPGLLGHASQLPLTL